MDPMYHGTLALKVMSEKMNHGASCNLFFGYVIFVQLNQQKLDRHTVEQKVKFLSSVSSQPISGSFSSSSTFEVK